MKVTNIIPYKVRHNIPCFNIIRQLYMNRIYKNYNYDYEQKLLSLKDIHKGKTCFLLGTGPSLNNINFELIKDDILFGTNTLYKALHKYNIKPRYYCVSDDNVWDKHKDGILEVDSTIILSGNAGRSYLQEHKREKNILVLKDLGCIYHNGWKESDITKGTYWGYSIMVDICLQVAFFMGFETVVLLGCDCNYSGKQHFDGEVYSFQKEKLDEHWKNAFTSYRFIKDVYEKNNRKIYNAGIESKLDIFEKKKLEEILNES